MPVICPFTMNAGISIVFLKIKTMKRLPVFTALLSLGFLLYVLYKKSGNEEEPQDIMEYEPHSHHITDVFAKAKEVATSHKTESGESL